ncbi:MAG: sel1 repeat family protein [Candidatus Azobacteroides sp.]|nr:sel1 repeat family protein [Candidatus Azobacteroides sp.]
MRHKQILLLTFFFILGLSGYSQSEKDDLKKAEKAEKKEEYTTAYSWYKKAGTQAAWLAAGELMYLELLPKDFDFKEIYDRLLPLAEGGDHKAQRYIGLMYREGYYVGKSTVKAGEWFEKAAADGDKIAQNDLAWEYSEQKRYEEAFRYFQLSAEQGFAPGENNLAWFYNNGLGVDQDLKKAEEWYKRAGKQGNLEAINNLGGLYQKDYHDNKKAFDQFLKAAKKGLKNAQRNVALCYLSGEVVGYNSGEGIKWMTKAAEQGLDKAQLFLAKKYLSEKDDSRAAYWFEKAAENDMVEAQFYIAMMYYSGTGVERNHEKAAYWWEKAAEQGDERAKKNLRLFD